MNIQTLFQSLALNIILSVVVVIVVVVYLTFQQKYLKKREEPMNKWLLSSIYLFSFIISVGAIFFLLYAWDYSLITYVNTMFTDLTTYLNQNIGSAVSSILVIFIASFFLRIVKMSLMRVGKKESPMMKRKQTIAKVTNSIVKYLVFIISILIILSIWGINVAPALAGLGIAGLVIGLGAQSMINDLISGFFIVFEHHFDVGDKIEVQGFKGEVTDIGLKSTRIRDWTGNTKIVNNGQISTLINYSRHYSIAIVDFGIAYQEDIQKTIDMLTIELPKIKPNFPMIIEDPQVLGVTSLSDSSVNLRVITKTLPEQHYTVEREIRKLIKQLLDANDIEIPFPQVTLNQPKKRD